LIRESVAYCGLFCESCGVYIATKAGDMAELGRMAQKMCVAAEDMACDGCRSERRSAHCRECALRDCAGEMGIVGCEHCEDFPCAELREFQAKLPHRAELFEAAELRKAIGLDAWMAKMAQDYSCPACGKLNSPYYPACPSCGASPANPFSARHASLFGR
jgi:hypothetical protein